MLITTYPKYRNARELVINTLPVLRAVLDLVITVSEVTAY